jgi:hypothetical protein
MVLARRDLKPCREQMWCVPQMDQPFVDRMEDVLEIYARLYDAAEPFVCIDEPPSNC